MISASFCPESSIELPLSPFVMFVAITIVAVLFPWPKKFRKS
jgi:hypothetical protein